MTVAYVVQVDTPKGKQYMTNAGKLSPVPKFFLFAPQVRLYLKRTQSWYNQYNANVHAESTRVIVIRELEKGLKDSKAEIYFYGEFMEKDIGSKSTNGIKNNPKAVYKIQLADKSFVTFGKPRPKYGKVWNRAGDLRSHITQYVGSHYNYLNTKYKGAEVVEIEYDTDGIMPKTVKRYPIMDFYLASPDSSKRYAHLISKLKV